MNVADTKFGAWVAPQSPVDVEYSLVVIEEIRQVVADGFQRLQRGGIEVGGVLYGTREGRIVRILAMREIACEHAHGPTFQLSENDRVALNAQIARDKEDMRLEGMLVVGWFLSHTRSEVTLQPSDLDIYSAFFPEPWQVTMVVHPGRVGAMRAGFFVREPDGRVESERSYLEFNFPARAPAMADRGPRERRPLMDAPPVERVPFNRHSGPPDAPGSRESIGSRESMGSRTGIDSRDAMVSGESMDARDQLLHPAQQPGEDPAARYDAPSFGQPAGPVPQYAPYPNTGRRMPWAIIAVVVAALLAGVAGLKYLGPQLNSEPLSLGMIEQNGQLQIQWNRASHSIVNAAGGTLEIVDGQDKRDIPMNRNELAQGSFTYVRHSGDVQVRLTVTNTGGEPMVEASRFLGAAPAQADSGEADKLKLERDALQEEVIRLRQQTGQQAGRIQQLERTMVILQSRLGIAEGR